MSARSQPCKAGDAHSSPLTEAPTSEAAREFHTWRNTHTIKDIKDMARDTQTRPTVAVLATGGCIDTIAAIKAGFKPVWATEICPDRRRMWEELTGTTCHGDIFNQDYTQTPTPDYLTSGQPCIDYAKSGSCSGDEGETGWMFTAQAQVIRQL